MAVTLTPSLAAGLGASPVKKADLQAWFSAILAAINSDLDPRATPIYASRSAAVSAAPDLPSGLTHVAVCEGTALVIRSRTASADDPLFETAPQWGVVQRQDGAAETTARINAIRDTGVLPLANVAGTANAITAEIAPAVPGVTLSALSTVELIPAADNTGAVTLNVGGVGAWSVQRRDGTALGAGDLKANASYLLRRRGNAWRLIGLALSEMQVSDANLITSRDVTVNEQGMVIASVAAGVVLTSTSRFQIFWPEGLAWSAAQGVRVPVAWVDPDGTQLALRWLTIPAAEAIPVGGSSLIISRENPDVNTWDYVTTLISSARVESLVKMATESAMLASRKVSVSASVVSVELQHSAVLTATSSVQLFWPADANWPAAPGTAVQLRLVDPAGTQLALCRLTLPKIDDIPVAGSCLVFSRENPDPNTWTHITTLPGAAKLAAVNSRLAALEDAAGTPSTPTTPGEGGNTPTVAIPDDGGNKLSTAASITPGGEITINNTSSALTGDISLTHFMVHSALLQNSLFEVSSPYPSNFMPRVRFRRCRAR